MVKLKNLIFEDNVEKEEDLGALHTLSEAGYTYLKNALEELNKKASKWNVPPMVLKIVKEEFIKRQIPINAFTRQKTTWEDPAVEPQEVISKQYTVSIEGEPPRVEGYEFVAKIEHTSDGNILNYAPKASIKTLPVEYRTARQACDVCKTTRDRNNTFILKLEKEDPQRFPDKKSGDYIMVGSNCLRRFLPNISANTLIEYAEMIESLRATIAGSGEIEDDFNMGGGGRGNWMEASQLAFWLSATYLHTGKYFSKKKAQELEAQPTLDVALQAMLPAKGDKNEIHSRVYTEEEFHKKSVDFSNEFLEWAKTKDFDTLIQQKPEYADFFHNLKVISKQDMLRIQNFGFFSALFQVFLRDKGELEKKAALKKATSDFTYFGQPGEKIKVKVKVNKIKEYESQWGRGLIVTMEAEGSETDPASGQSVSKKGNLLYFTSNFELEENEEAEITATVKSHQPNKFTQIPETVITRAKVVNFITHPEKNAGKQKIKNLKGVVRINQVREDTTDWTTGAKIYRVYFQANSEKNPELTNVYRSGINFVYTIPDEPTYQSLKPHAEKTVEAQWSLARAMTADKLKTEDFIEVSSFSIVRVIG